MSEPKPFIPHSSQKWQFVALTVSYQTAVGTANADFHLTPAENEPAPNRFSLYLCVFVGRGDGETGGRISSFGPGGVSMRRIEVAFPILAKWHICVNRKIRSTCVPCLIFSAPGLTSHIQ
jgi:hypothetical protein